MNVREMMARRGVVGEQARAVLSAARAQNRGLTHTEQAEFDKLMSESESLSATIEREERADSLDAELRQSAGRRTESILSSGDRVSRDQADLAVRAWALGSKATTTMRDAAARYGIDVNNPELELRALSEGTTSAGGYSVGNEAIRAFETAEKFFGPVRRVARVIETTTGAQMPCPTVDDTSNTGEIVGEGSGITTTADPLFGQTVLKPFKYSSKAVIVSMELLQDSAIPLAEVLFEELGKRIGRKQNTDFTAGAGTTLPFGIQVQASLGKTAAATNAITWDEVLDLQASVDPAYANRPGTGFMLHQSTANYLRKLKDSQNRYLWEMSLQGPSPAQNNNDGVAGRIAGWPVWINNDLDSAFSTNKRLVLFGHFPSYWIQDAGGPIFRRADELRLLTGEVVFVAFRRTDGALVNTAAVKYLRTA